MNKLALDGALLDLIAKKEGTEKLIAQLTRQVWQIDWTVAVYDIIGNYLSFNIPYFIRFMEMDRGDEAEEAQILRDWVDSRRTMNPEIRNKLPALIDELNQIRVTARK